MGCHRARAGRSLGGRDGIGPSNGRDGEGRASSGPRILAHRGGDGGPENSVAAIERAAAAGADGVEIDIQVGPGGDLVACHDLGAGSADGASLDEVVAATEAAGLVLLIDFKSAGDQDREAPAVADALSGVARPELVLVSSFSIAFLDALHRLKPELPLYPIVSLRQNFMTRLDFDRFSGVSALAAAVVVNPMLWLGPRRAGGRLLVWFALTEWRPLVRLATRLGAWGLIVKQVGVAGPGSGSRSV